MCKNYASKFIFWVISLKICVSNCIDGTPDKVSVFYNNKEAENMVRCNVSLAKKKTIKTKLKINHLNEKLS